MIQISIRETDKDATAMYSLIRFCQTGNKNYIVHQWYYLFECKGL